MNMLSAQTGPRLGRSWQLWLVAALVVGGALLFAPARVARSSPGADAFANPGDLASLNTSGTYSDAIANLSTFTRDAEEVAGLGACGNYPAPPANTYSVWYRYTPTANGWVTARTTAQVGATVTNYDTVLEVWKDSVSAAGRAACNDDALAGVERKSEVTFPVAAGSVYYLTVRKFNGGSYTMPTPPSLAFSASFSASRQIYVDFLNGNDNNTGSAEFPLRTIQKGVGMIPASGGTLNIVRAGDYSEDVTIDRSLTLQATAGAATVNSFTLVSGANIVASSAVSAPLVDVQPGAKVQHGVALVSSGGVVSLADGAYAENVVLDGTLTLRAANEGQATINPSAGAAVTLSGGAATVNGLNLGVTGGVGVNVTGGSAHTLFHNNIVGNAVGVQNVTGNSILAEANWWGQSSGPNTAGADTTSGTVDAKPWCESAIPGCGRLLGQATRLVIETQPSTTEAGEPIVVAVKAVDENGNLDTQFTGSISLVLTTPASGVTLYGTTAKNAVGGVATFGDAGDANIQKAGTGYVLTAQSGSLAAVATNPFDVTPGAAADLVFSQQPPASTTAGTSFSVEVTAVDLYGNVATSYNGQVDLSLSANPTGAPLNGAAQQSFVAGKVTWSGLSINTVGTGYQLSAISDLLVSPESNKFDITAAAAAALVFSQQPPASAAAGADFTVKVAVQDAYGNLVSNYTGSATLAFSSNPTGATLDDAAPVAFAGGEATFAGLDIDKAGTYKLKAASGALASQDSTSITIDPGPAAKLVFSQPPVDTRAGATMTVKVKAVDQYGNVVPSYAGSPSLALTTNPTSATPTITSGGVAGGEATFTVAIDRVGQGYVLTASDGALTSAASSPFKITADRLKVVVSPDDPTAAGAPLKVTVQAEDGFGTVDTTFQANVSLGFSAASTTGATLNGTATKKAVAGVATFGAGGDANITRAGAGYQLTASSANLISADTTTFAITGGAAVKLTVTTSPANPSGAGQALTVVVEAQDQFGNRDAAYAGTVQLNFAPAGNPTSATLEGTTSVTMAGGVASFGAAENVNIQLIGQGYVLRATSGSLQFGDTAPFDISSGSAAALNFSRSPSDTQAGVAFSSQPEVTVFDTYGNVATGFNGPVTLTIAAGTGAPGAILSGTVTVNAVAGVATFSGLSIDKIGTYRLTATSGTFTDTSGAFVITASGLKFMPSPSDSAAGVAFPTQPKVVAVDQAGNVDTTFNGDIKVALKSGAPRGAILSGTVTVTAVNGVATFTDLSVNWAYSGYIMTASSFGMPVGDSATFTITAGEATQLRFRAVPGSTPAEATFANQPVVEALDKYGNFADTFNGPVSVAIASGAPGAVLAGTTTANAVAGVATFSGMSIDRIGSYQLAATSAAMTGPNSPAFNITASQLVFDRSPDTTPVGKPFRVQPIVRAVDRYGTIDPNFAGSISLSVKSGTGTTGATLGGTRTTDAVGGVATFDGLSVDRLGFGYQLTAASTALGSGDSAPFAIVSTQVYLPALMGVPIRPDLVGSFKITPNTMAPGTPVEIAVTVTNQGDAPATAFWVDLYINPVVPPTTANTPWNETCGNLDPCYGIAWFVPGPLAPGQSVTLTSTPDSYFAKNTNWLNYFAAGTSDIYLYVDSWNRDVGTNTRVSYGAVFESDETNNRAEQHAVRVSGQRAAPAGIARPMAMPNRPAHPTRNGK